MNVRPWVICFGGSMLVLAGALPLQALGDDDLDRGWWKTSHHQHGNRHGKIANGLVEVVREATRRYRDVTIAEAEGYQLHFGCVSGPDDGAMGLHYVNMTLVGDGKLDATRPEIIIYEPRPNGRPRLIGADYLVPAELWDANNEGPPQLMGQLFQYFPSPNRFALPAFYTLHVWAWKTNPNGTFVNWNPRVSCDAFDGQGH